MHSPKTRNLAPGKYQFRANPFEPWVDIRVYREFVENHETLKANWAGVEIDAEKIAQHGEWKPLFKD